MSVQTFPELGVHSIKSPFCFAKLGIVRPFFLDRKALSPWWDLKRLLSRLSFYAGAVVILRVWDSYLRWSLQQPSRLSRSFGNLLLLRRKVHLPSWLVGSNL